jgi:hypothetical protein
MARLKMVILLLAFLSSAIIVSAQGNNDPIIPEGMEAIPIGGGGGQLIVPKGAKTRQVGAQIIVEGTKEYMSRMVFEMDQRLTKIEKSQEDLKKEVATLKDVIEKLQENSGVEESPAKEDSSSSGGDQGGGENRKIETVDGTVTNVDFEANTIVVDTDGREMAFSVANDTKISRGEKSIKLQDIEETDSVTVFYYSPSVGTYVAVSIADNSRAR